MVDANHPWMALDLQLESELKTFQDVEWWKDTEDHFLGPQIFLSLDQIHHLYHVTHAKPLVTINDLQTNFKWSWMEDYGSALLCVIHHVYKPEAYPFHLIQFNEDYQVMHEKRHWHPTL